VARALWRASAGIGAAHEKVVGVDLLRTPTLALVAAGDASGSPDPSVDAVRRLAAERGTALHVCSPASHVETREIRRTNVVSSVVVDAGLWRSRAVQVARGAVAAVSLQVGSPPMRIDEWAAGLLRESGATWALTPSFHVGDAAALDALLAATEQVRMPELVTHLPVDAGVLAPGAIDGFLAALARTRPRPFAFTFTAGGTPFDRPQTLLGLRRLLAVHPGSHVYGVAPLVAADALAHGAGLVSVGPSALAPRAPGVAEVAEGPLPALFLETLLELRSPSDYADWFAGEESPWCDTCAARLDLFDPTDADRAAIARHNAHAVDDLGRWLLAHDPADRAAALAARLADALDAHAALTADLGGAAPVVDATLSALCALETTT